MTFIMVLLLGAGTLLISSSLDCTPIQSTFQKIASGQQIDWSGSQCQSQPITFSWPSILGISSIPPAGLITKPDANGNCPTGYVINTQGQCIRIMK